jgi:hypothetical protein
MYKRFSVEVIQEQKRDQRLAFLRFGRLVDLDQQRALILDAELCASVF